MIIGILGAGGFIGSNLIEYLLERDEHLLVGVDNSDDKLAGIGGPQFEFIKADVTTEVRVRYIARPALFLPEYTVFLSQK